MLFGNILGGYILIKETDKLGFEYPVLSAYQKSFYLIAVNKIINHSLAYMKDSCYIVNT